jgi:hypothetical protein
MKRFSWFALVNLSGGGAMDNRRYQFIDRRQDMDMPKAPFKDSKGAIIKENRRKKPGRRRFDDTSPGNSYIRS